MNDERYNSSFIIHRSSFTMIPPLDPTRQYQSLKPEIDAAVLELLASGQYVLGPAVESFENAAAKALGTRHAIGVANGTDALLLALRAHDIGPGDEVIVPPFTFIATAEVVSLAGATPVFCDIENDTLCLDASKLAEKITPKTKAIIPVHLFGHPADMEAIGAIAREAGVLLLEDAAQAWGAKLQMGNDWKNCGALGDIAGFSFYPTKNLGACGEGGLISTDDDELAEKCRMLRTHGQRRRYIHDAVGINSRLHAMQAAILNVKLPHVQKWNDLRRAHAAKYNAAFSDLDLQTPIERDGAHHIYHQYTLRVPAERREKISESLTQDGIGWAVYYPVPLHLQPVYEDLNYSKGDFPVTENAAEEVLSLPVFPELREDETDAVIKAVRRALT
jgi:dTDP-4-amino-4,6-dideoxygalactose transaminase